MPDSIPVSVRSSLCRPHPGHFNPREEDSLHDTLKNMRARSVGRVPVIDTKGQIAGVLSIDDIISLLASELNDIDSLILREQEREGGTAHRSWRSLTGKREVKRPGSKRFARVNHPRFGSTTRSFA